MMMPFRKQEHYDWMGWGNGQTITSSEILMAFSIIEMNQYRLKMCQIAVKSSKITLLKICKMQFHQNCSTLDTASTSSSGLAQVPVFKIS
jgi:hypothetical protein